MPELSRANELRDALSMRGEPPARAHRHHHRAHRALPARDARASSRAPASSRPHRYRALLQPRGAHRPSSCTRCSSRAATAMPRSPVSSARSPRGEAATLRRLLDELARRLTMLRRLGGARRSLAIALAWPVPARALPRRMALARARRGARALAGDRARRRTGDDRCLLRLRARRPRGSLPGGIARPRAARRSPDRFRPRFGVVHIAALTLAAAAALLLTCCNLALTAVRAEREPPPPPRNSSTCSAIRCPASRAPACSRIPYSARVLRPGHPHRRRCSPRGSSRPCSSRRARRGDRPRAHPPRPAPPPGAARVPRLAQRAPVVPDREPRESAVGLLIEMLADDEREPTAHVGRRSRSVAPSSGSAMRRARGTPRRHRGRIPTRAMLGARARPARRRPGRRRLVRGRARAAPRRRVRACGAAAVVASVALVAVPLAAIAAILGIRPASLTRLRGRPSIARIGERLLDWVLDTVQAVDPVARTLLAGLGIMLETSILIGLIVPGDTIVLVASTARRRPGEYFALIAAVIVGALIGESIGFALGRWFGPQIRALAARPADRRGQLAPRPALPRPARRASPCSSRASCRCCTR